MVTGQTAEGVTLATYVNGKIESTTIPRGEYEKMDTSSVSLMPEKMLDGLSDTEIQNLFAYLTRDR